MQNLPASPKKLANALQLFALAMIAILTTACEWVPPPATEEIFLNPTPETNFGDTSGAVGLSELQETPTCYTTDGTVPFYDLASCLSGTTQLYTGAIALSCEVEEYGSAVLRIVNLAFGWPGEPLEPGDIVPPTVEYRGANFYLDCGIAPDGDADGIPDAEDNCPSVANAGQEDWNTNGIGDACEDSDSDLVMDDIDNCVSTPNTLQEDWNTNGVGDACENSDGDTLMDDVDNCPGVDNEGQEDNNNDGIGNACETPGTGYYLYNLRTDRCPETVSSSNVNVAACVPDTPDSQAFSITEIGTSGSYLIESQSIAGRCIAAGGGTSIDMAACNSGSGSQQWVFTPDGAKYQISPTNDSDCLRDGASEGDLHLFDCTSTKAEWDIFDRGTHALIDPNTL
ncbi:MAG: thrombospondin type 3 repeat-containing protein [Pseudomonadales bacterium]|nr:thrombospondin type 3 repeat-containing protein [Pseudomonadales bacterium]